MEYTPTSRIDFHYFILLLQKASLMFCFCAVLYLANTYIINMLVGSLVNIYVHRFIASLFLSYL
jgi:hypothetical protein